MYIKDTVTPRETKSNLPAAKTPIIEEFEFDTALDLTFDMDATEFEDVFSQSILLDVPYSSTPHYSGLLRNSPKTLRFCMLHQKQFVHQKRNQNIKRTAIVFWVWIVQKKKRKHYKFCKCKNQKIRTWIFQIPTAFFRWNVGHSKAEGTEQNSKCNFKRNRFFAWGEFVWIILLNPTPHMNTTLTKTTQIKA